MPLPVDRSPPSVSEMLQRLAARNATDGCIARPEITTIPAVARGPCPIRRARSLRTCHLPREERPLTQRHETRGYTPQLAESLDRDPNLCDGARTTGRIVAAYIHRRDRSGYAEISVSFLMRATGRSRRTIQRHLRQLERAGYIAVEVIVAATRVCAGLAVRLLGRIMPAHGWQQAAKPIKPTAPRRSQNHRFRYKLTLSQWALRCCDGVWRSYMKTITPPAPFVSLH